MLNVYMTGVIYFNGCNETDKCVYAPDGSAHTPKHYASLWIREVDVEGDDWFSGLTDQIPRTLGDVPVIEFRIPSPVTLTFPATGSISCTGLDGGLAKLKKKQGSNEADLEVAATAQTIAEIPIEGGTVRPRLYKGIRLIGWTIDGSSSVQITATPESGEPGSITVRDGAEVVFTNIPEITHHGSGDNVILFDKLTTQPGLLIANPPSGSANPIPGNDEILDAVRFGVLGNTPGCCHG
jgi:hypothetical protein